jgi:VanZ family protein
VLSHVLDPEFPSLKIEQNMPSSFARKGTGLHFFRIFCAIATLLLITVLFVAGQTGHAGGLFKPPLDKVAHIGFWFTCATLGQIASGNNSLRRWLVLVLLLLLASLDEVVQIWTIGRDADMFDALANAVGISVSALAGFVLRRIGVKRQ